MIVGYSYLRSVPSFSVGSQIKARSFILLIRTTSPLFGVSLSDIHPSFPSNSRLIVKSSSFIVTFNIADVFT